MTLTYLVGEAEGHPNFNLRLSFTGEVNIHNLESIIKITNHTVSRRRGWKRLNGTEEICYDFYHNNYTTVV